MDVVFLGVNNMGWEIYEWLCDRDTVTVQALITTESQLDLMEDLSPDMAIACGFGKILEPEYLSIPDRGCINVHPGYLPNTRGYNPNVWSIVEGHPAGVTIHRMDESVDSGDILARKMVETSFEDTGRDLYRRIEAAAVSLFRDVWPDIQSGDVTPIPQEEDEATTHFKQDFIDLCEIDPDDRYKAKDLLNTLRALTYPPFRNAYVDVDGERYYVEVTITPESEVQDGQAAGLLSEY